MKVTIDETGKRARIDMEGPVTIRNIAEAREFLMAALLQVDVLEFENWEHLPEMDLSGLQLGCSLKRTALKLDKTIMLPKNPSPEVSRLMEGAGVCFYGGCVLDGDRCFFSKRGLD